MSVTAIYGGWRLDAEGDVLSGGVIARAILHVNKTGSAGTATINTQGISGTTILHGETGANDTSILYEGAPIPVTDLALETLDAGHVVVFGTIG